MNQKIEELKKNLAEKIPKQKRITVIVVIGLIGIVLIFMSDMFSAKPHKSNQNNTVKLDSQSYKKELESELTDVLSQVQGVGKVRVMVNLEGSTENIYAEEYDTKSDTADGKKSESYKNKYVVIDKGSEKNPLLKKVVKPKINGVIVVCEGGDNVLVSEKVYKAVSTVLAISSNRVCVVKG